MYKTPLGTTILAFVAITIMAPTSTHAVDQEALQALLDRPIVGPDLPLAQMQEYCQARVPRVPQVGSVADWETTANRLRAQVLDRIVYRGQAAKQWRDAETRVEWLDTIEGGPGYRIKKLRFEILPGMWTVALLYEPEKLSGKVPVILNVNGHSAEGKQYKPKQLRCINQAKRGMLALNVEWLGMGQLHTDGFMHYRMNQLDLCGASGLAPFFLSMKRSIDILLSLENADPERLAVTGLSGGGWQTIIISSLDTRVKLSTPVAGYSSFLTRAVHLSDLGDSEQTPNDLATLVDYTHLTAMMAPRPTLLVFNKADNCCFASGHALQPLLDAAEPVFRLYGKEDALKSHVNEDPGTHNYEVDNRQAFYRMLGEFFYPGDEDFNTQEIPSEDEIKTAEELFVELPDPNQDFNTLAKSLAESLPRDGALPGEKQAALDWQRERRAALGKIVRLNDYAVSKIGLDSEEKDGLNTIFWKLDIGETWTLPAIELAGKEPTGTVLLIADGGRKSMATRAGKLLEEGHRVVAVDLSDQGEMVLERNMLFPLLVAAVGERPLGVQSGQLAAVSRWLADDRGLGPVTVTAVGPRATTIALVAAAMDEKAIARLELHDALDSLKEVIERNLGANNGAELFCFGLLESFDIKQIAALTAPRPVSFTAPSDRVKSELVELEGWYGLLGSEFNPLK
jgi:acetyl xylan esterase AXE1